MSELRLRKRNSTWEYSFEGARINGKRKTISKGGFRTKGEASAAGVKAMNEYIICSGNQMFKLNYTSSHIFYRL